METQEDKKYIVFMAIVFTAIASIFISEFIIKQTPSSDDSHYNAMVGASYFVHTFFNSLTCLTALFCLKPKIRQNKLHYYLSLYGLLLLYNIIIFIISFPFKDILYRLQEAIAIMIPSIVFIIGQTILGIILNKTKY